MIDLSNKKLELTYPCKWCYKIVLHKDTNPNVVVKNILNDKKHNITNSKSSSKGKYKSYNINLIVNNETERLDLYNKLLKHKDIKMVI